MLQFCPQGRSCALISCDTFILEKESATRFKLSGEMHFKDLRHLAEVGVNLSTAPTHATNVSPTETLPLLQNVDFFQRFTGDKGSVDFRSLINVTYDKRKYVLDSQKQVC